MRLSLLPLLPAVLGFRAGLPLPPAGALSGGRQVPVLPAAAVGRGRSVPPPVLLAKKKKGGKAPAAAAKALEALEQWDAAQQSGDIPDPVAAGLAAVATPAKPKKGKKKKGALAPEALQALESLEAAEAAGLDGMVPAAPPPVKKKARKEDEEASPEPPPPDAEAAPDEPAEAVEPAEADVKADQEVRLSKKKQGKKKVAPPDGEAAPESGRDASGRRGMGTRFETFTDAPPGFAYLKLSEGTLRFGTQDVLTQANWDVQTGQRVGLVGNNGAGKTTQLRVLAGEIDLDSGEIVKSSSEIKVAMLRQEFREELREGRSLKEEMLSVFGEVLELRRQYDDAEARLAGAGEDEGVMQSAIEDMAKLQAELDGAGASTIELRADKMISAMGFTVGDADLPVSAFSGGWKMRIGLGKILLQEPQVLLLDEPTNHMDLDSVEWLEDYLTQKTSKLALVIVSHDREFLDRVCTKIVETEFGVTYTYNGNYRTYLKQKDERRALDMSRWEAQQKQIKELRAEMNRLRDMESAAVTVKQKERQLNEMLEGGAEHIARPYTQRRPFQFRFPPAPRCSQELVELEGLGHGYGDSTLFRDVNLCIERGDRIAIIGPNGAGKSTLLKLILNKEQPSEGRAEIVAANAVTQYFEQDQANALPLDYTVLQCLEDAASDTRYEYEQLRALLGKFMFKEEKVHDKVSLLSGGEKARVALCRMMLTKANLLLLDEPTNHLDIAAKEVLEEALQNFEGTVIMVSHDRFFLSQTANTIVALEDQELNVYDGDYRTYMERNEDAKAKIVGRYTEGLPTITSAPKIDLRPGDNENAGKKKKNFGGKGGPSGDKTKGIKNAKRMR